MVGSTTWHNHFLALTNASTRKELDTFGPDKQASMRAPTYLKSITITITNTITIMVIVVKAVIKVRERPRFFFLEFVLNNGWGSKVLTFTHSVICTANI